jgi:hypothetical protein
VYNQYESFICLDLIVKSREMRGILSDGSISN